MLVLHSFNHNRILTRSLMIAVLAATGIILGVAPDLSRPFSPSSFSSTALAQNITETELQNYARAVLAIEPLRQTTYAEIKKQMAGAQIPNITCAQADTLNQLPPNIRTIAANYCNKSRELVISNNLTVQRFNEITRNVQNDEQLKARIQDILIQIQQSSQ